MALGLLLGMEAGPLARPAAAVPVVVIEGRGWGHGVGMAQDGAFWLAQAGQSHVQILARFYPGTTVAKRGGSIRVPLTSGSFTAVLPQGGRVGGEAVGPGFQVTVRASSGGTGGGDGTGGGEPGGTTASAALAPAQNEPAAADQLVAIGPSRHRIQLVASVRAQNDSGTVQATVPATTASASGVEGTAGTSPVTSPAPEPAATLATPLSTVEPGAHTEPGAGSTGSLPVGDPSSNPAGPSPGGASPPVPGPSAPVPSEPSATEATPLNPSSGSSGIAVAPGGSLRVSAAPGGVIAVGGRRVRGSLEVVNRGGLRAVNELDVEDYLRGMGEIGRGLNYPSAALKAQAVAARTYAFRTMATTGEICASDRCQVYLGAQAEYPAMDDAVAATRGQVLTYGGKLAATFFSASSGGESGTVEEGFGGTNLPYLVAAPYVTGDLREWSLSATAAELGYRLGYPGTASAVAITQTGPSGRPLEVTIDGSSGPRRLAGLAVKKALRLRSTLWTIRVTESAIAPTLPADGGGDTSDDQSILLREPTDTVSIDSSPVESLALTTTRPVETTQAPTTTVAIPTSTRVEPVDSITAAVALRAEAVGSGGGLRGDLVLGALTAIGLALVGFAVWRWFRGVEAG